MTDFVWPSDLAPYVEGFNLLPHTGGSQSPFTRQMKTYVLSSPIWTAQLSFRGGDSDTWGTDGAAFFGPRLDALRSRLRGRANRIAVWDFRRPGSTPWLLNHGVSAGDNIVTITNGNLKLGDYIGGDERPHLITNISNSGTDQVVEVEPPFSTAIAPGAMTGEKVTAWFRLTEDTSGQAASEVGALTVYNFELIEDPQVSAFAPTSLFAASEEGFLFDVQDLDTLFSDTAGTVPAVLNGPVGKMLDLSGNANHAVAPGDNYRPYLRQKPDGRYYLDFAYFMGSAKRLNVAAFALTASGEYQAAAAITPRNVVAPQSVLDAYSATAALRQFIMEVETGTAFLHAYNTTSNGVTAEGSLVPNIEVGRTVTIGGQVRSSKVTGYVNGVPGQTTALTSMRQATNGVTIGALNSADSNFMNAEFFGAFWRAGAALSDAEMRRAMDYLGGVAKASAPAAGSESFGVHGGTWPWYEQASGWPAVYNAATNETWITWETYDARRTERYMAVTAYDHETGTFGDVYRIGYTNLADDSHGVPSLTFDANGYGHVFGGAHGNGFPDMMHFKTVRPNDPTEWEKQPDIVGNYTYPHPSVVGTEMWLAQRNQFPNDFPLDMFRGDIASDGTITWDSPFTLVDFGADSRVYNFRNEVHGTEIHMAMTRANAADTERLNVYFVRFDTATGEASNLAGTYTTSTFPIDDATMTANFQLVTTTAAEFAVFDFEWDPITPSKLHLVYGDAADWKYLNYTNGTPGSTSVIAVRDFRDAGALSIRDDGTLEFIYGKDPDALWPRYGDIYRITRSPAGTWGSDELIRTATAKALGAPHAVRDAHPDLRFIYAEIGQDEAVEELRLRMYALGDSGPITRLHTGPTRAVLYFDGALSPAATIGSEVGMLELWTPLQPPITSGIEVVNDAPFTVENGYLEVTGQLGVGEVDVELRARDFDGFTGTTTLTIIVSADPAYTWANAEGRWYVERTGVFWSVGRKQALDTFISALKTAGVWTQLDVLVPPKPLSPFAGLQNLVQDAYRATIVHDPLKPLVFSPGLDQTEFPPGEFWYTHEGSQSYIDTGFNPTLGSPQYQRNSASFGLRSIAGDSAGAVIGWYDGSDGSSLQPMSPSGVMSIRVNQGSTQGVSAASAITSRNGLFAANRSGASAIQAYLNGVDVPLSAGSTEASVAVNNANFRIGNPVAGTFISYKWDGYFFGQSLTAAEHLALSNAWFAYEAAIAAL